MFEYIKADLARFKEEGGGSPLRILARGLVSQGFQAILVYRFFRWFFVRGIPTQPFRFIIERLTEIMTGISIPAETDIGKGLRIHHFGGIIFHSHTKMGEHCTVYHGVTFGDKGGAGEPPTIGNNVLVGAGAKVLGEITIGDNVKIGANAVVVASVPNNAIVGGVPAKIIGENTKDIWTMKAPKTTINVMQCRSTYTTGGGPDKTVLLMAERSNKEKFRHVLMYMRGANDHEFQIGNWARERGLTIHEVLEYKKLDWSNLVEIHRLIKQYDIDILHVRDHKTCVVCYLASLPHPKVKLLFTAHLWQDHDSLKMKFYTWLNLLFLKRYDKIIAVSYALKDFMVKRGIRPEKITVVHNAIDVDAWNRANVRSTIRDEFQIPASRKIVGVVGRLRYEKDLPTTLAVAHNVIRERPDTCFLIIGDGPDRADLERQVNEIGLADKILFLGFRKDTMNIYAALDLFLSTARIEGTPNTALEAMAMEAPVIYTEVGGVGEIIQNGHDGLLFQVGDIAGITAATLNVLNNEEFARQLRENGRRSACEKFSFTKRLQTVEGIYEALARGK
ncbi:group 1 glycosyl transferase [Candidatus Moduliflexus flocculans]|uniref:Group 1 glycosyl transferase n=1 Tax=Candidatus Moduliflexus flocculans TaxID=1499966 RepID=A0A081BM06_9BACT|nr:group 1 glycosyl transferase [Candidatus Moduliflexus flocculans]